MADIQHELATATDAVAALARQAPYVAIGMGVLAFQRAQVRRRELLASARSTGSHAGPTELRLAERAQLVKRAKEFDATIAQVIRAVDATVEPVIERLPESLRVVVQHAREARDDLRTKVFGPPS